MRKTPGESPQGESGLFVEQFGQIVLGTQLGCPSVHVADVEIVDGSDFDAVSPLELRARLQAPPELGQHDVFGRGDPCFYSENFSADSPSDAGLGERVFRRNGEDVDLAAASGMKDAVEPTTT